MSSLEEMWGENTWRFQAECLCGYDPEFPESREFQVQRGKQEGRQVELVTRMASDWWCTVLWKFSIQLKPADER